MLEIQLKILQPHRKRGLSTLHVHDSGWRCNSVVGSKTEVNSQGWWFET